MEINKREGKRGREGYNLIAANISIYFSMSQHANAIVVPSFINRATKQKVFYRFIA